jgi:hypothetical protein
MSYKNEMHFSGGITLPAGAAVSATYSPFNHVAFQIHGFVTPDEGQHLQGIAGYYWSNGSPFRFEIYGGLAKGQGKTIKASNPGFLKGDYKTYFTQFNLGQTTFGHKQIEYGLGIKTGLFDVEVTDNGFYESDGLDPVYYHNRYILIEPVAFVRFGGKGLKTGLQINGASLINAIAGQRQIPYHTLSLGLSLNYHFPVGTGK